MLPLYNGIPTFAFTPMTYIKSPVSWLRAISDLGATNSSGPVFAYDYCIKRVTDQQLDGLDLSRWRSAGISAERVHDRTLRAFAHRFGPVGFHAEAFCPGYGLAENTLMATARPHGEAVRVLPPEAVPGSTSSTKWPLVSSGAPVGTRVLVVDPSTRRICPPGAVGEVWLSGPSVALGYWNRPAETEETFAAKPAGPAEDEAARFLRTGDLGMMRDGELFITGRLKELIIVQGANHYPEDLERTVHDTSPVFAGLRGAAFAADDDAVERLVVVHEVNRAKLADEVVAEIALTVRQAVTERNGIDLSELVLVPRGSIPKTTSGKVQRRICQAQWADGSLKVIGSWPGGKPRQADRQPHQRVSGRAADAAQLRKWLVRRVAAMSGLGVDQIDPAQPFARYGMSSVGVSQVAGELEAFLGRTVQVSAFFEHPTVDALVRHLTGSSPAVAATTATHAPQSAPAAAVRAEWSRRPSSGWGYDCRVGCPGRPASGGCCAMVRTLSPMCRRTAGEWQTTTTPIRRPRAGRSAGGAVSLPT